jgi:hypothetical protein
LREFQQSGGGDAGVRSVFLASKRAVDFYPIEMPDFLL